MSTDVSIVVPVMNEEENVPLLIDSVRRAMGEGRSWELILVDDGSTDRTRERIREAAGPDRRIRLVELSRNYGQSTAMQAGFDHCRGRIVVTMDGDLQNDPADIPEMVETLDAGGYDLVAGYRLRRKDRFFTRKVPSWIANRIIALMTGVSIRDNGCSLKVYRRDLLQRMRLYSDMHRFIPALAVGTAGARITEVPVRHHPRLHGESKYGLSRVGKVLADLLTIKMIRSFRHRPLTLAGVGAVLSLVLGTVFGARAVLDQLDGGWSPPSMVYVSCSLVWVAVGVFLLMLGLVGEAVVEQNERDEHVEPLLTREILS